MNIYNFNPVRMKILTLDLIRIILRKTGFESVLLNKLCTLYSSICFKKQ